MGKSNRNKRKLKAQQSAKGATTTSQVGTKTPKSTAEAIPTLEGESSSACGHDTVVPCTTVDENRLSVVPKDLVEAAKIVSGEDEGAKEEFFPCNGDSESDFVVVKGMSQELLKESTEAVSVLNHLLSVCQELHGTKHTESFLSELSGIKNHDDGRKSVKEFQKEKQTLVDENTQLRDQNALLAKKMQCMAERTQELETHNEELANVKVNFETEKETKSKEYQDKLSKIRQLEEKNEGLKVEVQKAQVQKGKIEELQNDLLQWKQKLEDSRRNQQGQNQQIKCLRDEKLTWTKEKKQLEDRIKQQHEDNNGLTMSLSKLMNDKMNQDESQVENICIKARPMKLMEDFELFCSDDWLSAKTELDDCKDVLFLMSEERKQTILLDILTEAYHRSENLVVYHMKRVQTCLDTPLELHHEGPSFPVQLIADSANKMPSELESEINKYLKVHSDEVNCDAVAECVLEKVLQVIPDNEKNSNIRSSEILLAYAKKACVLTWKMVIQRPPMYFTADDDIGKDFNADKYDLCFESVGPNTPDVKILRCVHPCLWHNQTLMKKGRVVLGLK